MFYIKLRVFEKKLEIRETNISIDSFGLRSTSFFHASQSIQFYNMFRARSSKTPWIPNRNSKLCAPKLFFRILAEVYNGFKKHCNTTVKVPEMIPKPLFSHTVSAGNRFFKNAFD